VMQHICHDVSEKFTTVRFGHVVFTARCYASEVLAVGLCPSVCRKSVFCRNG